MIIKSKFEKYNNNLTTIYYIYIVCQNNKIQQIAICWILLRNTLILFNSETTIYFPKNKYQQHNS